MRAILALNFIFSKGNDSENSLQAHLLVMECPLDMLSQLFTVPLADCLLGLELVATRIVTPITHVACSTTISAHRCVVAGAGISHVHAS